jgi:hypothetical protein
MCLSDGVAKLGVERRKLDGLADESCTIFFYLYSNSLSLRGMLIEMPLWKALKIHKVFQLHLFARRSIQSFYIRNILSSLTSNFGD